ncbi:MAG: FKBP-type peptidyl-prolyl cis-trans isomerase [Gracilimonas sp.]|nr:FKBP-type peptidyl-prolyl cis-trans isomerase [Gracilimonas sp.]
MHLYFKAVLAALFLTIIVISSGCFSDTETCNYELNLAGVDESQLEEDIAAIDAYLAENNIEDVQEHSSGLRYVINESGSGKTAELCSQVTVNYQGQLMSDGTIFDQSQSPVTFPLRNLIYGWQIGIPLIQSGGSTTFYIPSVYAYGSRGSGESIPPNANLIFEIDLISVQ